MREMICYEFVFTTDDGSSVTKDIWADFETQAWWKASDIAFEEGYLDYDLKGEQ